MTHTLSIGETEVEHSTGGYMGWDRYDELLPELAEASEGDAFAVTYYSPFKARHKGDSSAYVTKIGTITSVGVFIDEDAGEKVHGHIPYDSSATVEFVTDDGREWMCRLSVKATPVVKLRQEGGANQHRHWRGSRWVRQSRAVSDATVVRGSGR